ncbi:hypothetical protein [Lentzea sp. CC55]|uniref:hypothetical protein n=1 Tax=Lentzea sp. CC55 TaxID=2884909 RepID=UPI001F45039D|nr:hypothetical protein [Lentzea sp. CC55]MCG8924071.1 hypothetical protein [Lentzea sp. CC55]
MDTAAEVVVTTGEDADGTTGSDSSTDGAGSLRPAAEGFATEDDARTVSVTVATETRVEAGAAAPDRAARAAPSTTTVSVTVDRATPVSKGSVHHCEVVG